MIALITAVLPVIFKLIELVIDGSKQKQALRRSFIIFVEQMQSETKSPRLTESYNNQVLRLKEKLKKDGGVV